VDPCRKAIAVPGDYPAAAQEDIETAKESRKPGSPSSLPAFLSGPLFEFSWDCAHETALTDGSAFLAPAAALAKMMLRPKVGGIMTRLTYILPILALTVGAACTTGPGDGHIPREREPNSTTTHWPGATPSSFKVPKQKDAGGDVAAFDFGPTTARDVSGGTAIDPGAFSCDIPGVDSASLFAECRSTPTTP
jgi:hypothetical protein